MRLWKKKRTKTVLIIIAMGVVILGAVKIHHPGVPSHLQVTASDETNRFCPPPCLATCASDSGSFTLSVQEAFKKGYKPSEVCLAEGWFNESEVSLLTEILHYIGIWSVHPWSRGGAAWRTTFHGKDSQNAQQYKEIGDAIVANLVLADRIADILSGEIAEGDAQKFIEMLADVETLIDEADTRIAHAKILVKQSETSTKNHLLLQVLKLYKKFFALDEAKYENLRDAVRLLREIALVPPEERDVYYLAQESSIYAYDFLTFTVTNQQEELLEALRKYGGNLPKDVMEGLDLDE